MTNLNIQIAARTKFKAIPMQTRKIVNVASVPKLSPFRYPGGKTWLVPQIRKWLDSLLVRPRYFVEPFAGGGIASLTAVIDNKVDIAVMCELDRGVAAVWHVVLDDAEWLIDRILGFKMTVNNVQKILNRNVRSRREIAFQTIVRNRAQRGGILARGASLMKKGENGNGIASRWYPETLAKRIALIHSHRDKIRFVEGNGLAIVRQYLGNPRAAFFIDPPYTAGGKKAGKRLYSHNDIDHGELFGLMQRATGQFMMTYDEAPEVVKLAQANGFNLTRVPMKNTHNTKMFELLITSRLEVQVRHRAIA